MPEVRIAPPNSLILIMDPAAREVPESLGGELIAATQSCLAIGTRAAMDGDTFISFGEYEAAAHQPPVLDRIMNTPQRKLAVCTVLKEPLMTLSVPDLRTRVRVWTNDAFEPYRVRIAVGD